MVTATDSWKPFLQILHALPESVSLSLEEQEAEEEVCYEYEHQRDDDSGRGRLADTLRAAGGCETP